MSGRLALSTSPIEGPFQPAHSQVANLEVETCCTLATATPDRATSVGGPLGAGASLSEWPAGIMPLSDRASSCAMIRKPTEPAEPAEVCLTDRPGWSESATRTFSLPVPPLGRGAGEFLRV